MKRLLPMVLFASALGCLEPPQGDIVSCKQEWFCDDAVVADKDPADPAVDPEGLVFCTDPADPDRDVDINTYEEDFHDTCDGATVQCVGGGVAECFAACVPGGGACDLATKSRVKLD